MGLEDFNGIFFDGFSFWESLIVVKVDEVGRSIVLSSLSVFGAVPSEVPYFSALETGIRSISCGSCIALEVVLRAIPLISIGVLPSTEVISSVVPSVVSSGRCPVPIYVHRDRGVVHPMWGI